MINFLCYPKCSTCQKAKRWLESNNISFTERHIVDNNPTYEELKKWFIKSGLPIKRFFNTSGVLYKELSLKEKLSIVKYLYFPIRMRDYILLCLFFKNTFNFLKINMKV